MLLNKKDAQKAIDECDTDILTTFWPFMSYGIFQWTDAQLATYYLLHSVEQASHIQSITFTVYAYDDVNGASAKVGQL